ncbi:MAG: hypothetical protein E6R03_11340 [Hyphomicrobiaceae bacterium]|nr:MAG: hypothetical protein E6R03_11340 [Hyphomicrobiaceae bacterium]
MNELTPLMQAEDLLDSAKRMAEAIYGAMSTSSYHPDSHIGRRQAVLGGASSAMSDAMSKIASALHFLVLAEYYDLKAMDEEEAEEMAKCQLPLPLNDHDTLALPEVA